MLNPGQPQPSPFATKLVVVTGDTGPWPGDAVKPKPAALFSDELKIPAEEKFNTLLNVCKILHPSHPINRFIPLDLQAKMILGVWSASRSFGAGAVIPRTLPIPPLSDAQKESLKTACERLPDNRYLDLANPAKEAQFAARLWESGVIADISEYIGKPTPIAARFILRFLRDEVMSFTGKKFRSDTPHGRDATEWVIAIKKGCGKEFGIEFDGNTLKVCERRQVEFQRFLVLWNRVSLEQQIRSPNSGEVLDFRDPAVFAAFFASALESFSILFGNIAPKETAPRPAPTAEERNRELKSAAMATISDAASNWTASATYIHKLTEARVFELQLIRLVGATMDPELIGRGAPTQQVRCLVRAAVYLGEAIRSPTTSAAVKAKASEALRGCISTDNPMPSVLREALRQCLLSRDMKAITPAIAVVDSISREKYCLTAPFLIGDLEVKAEKDHRGFLPLLVALIRCESVSKQKKWASQLAEILARHKQLVIANNKYDRKSAVVLEGNAFSNLQSDIRKMAE